ncbi:MAG TPA: STAS domain-containing protein [Herpetosiphonaceae bacterium]|nr:STAS domain-containing protein [Herpetosiphonaceae bacterium]
MSTSDALSLSHANDRKRLRQSLWWIIWAAGGAAVTYPLVGLWLDQPVLLALGLACGVFLPFPALALLYLGRGRPRRAIAAICVGILLLGLAIALLVTNFLPVLAVIPVTTIVLALPYIDSELLRRLIGLAWVLALLMIVVNQAVRVIEPLPATLMRVVNPIGMALTLGVTLGMLWQFHHRLQENLANLRAAHAGLSAANASLESQVAERTSALSQALADVEARSAEQARLLEENEQQRATIYELSVPVLPISANTYVMPLVGALDSERLGQVQERALQAISHSAARRLVLDITGVPVVDTQVAQGLMHIVQAAGLLGAQVWLVGIRPEVAQAMVGLGLTLDGIQTFGNLQSALSASN